MQGLQESIGMHNWLIPPLSHILRLGKSPKADRGAPQAEEWERARRKAHRQWSGAIAALEQLLRIELASSTSSPSQPQGLVLSSPAPVLSDEQLSDRLQIGVFSPEAWGTPSGCRQLPGAGDLPEDPQTKFVEFPLLPGDRLTQEQFCLVFATNFSLVMVLGEDATGKEAFQFSFEPEVTKQAWAALRSRLQATSPTQLPSLEGLIQTFPPPTPDYRLVTEFSRLLLDCLPDWGGDGVLSPHSSDGDGASSQRQAKRPHSEPACSTVNGTASEETACESPTHPHSEIELLQALTHEIRTPLTTIRMLVRLLLKRRDLDPGVIERLKSIDQECTAQINRMELIFRAAELEATKTKQTSVQLTPISLERVFQQNIPHWQKQAKRRNVTLEVVLPETLPTVVSNPAMLDQALTGLMENFTSSLPMGGQVQVQVTTAGNQLKLQLLSSYRAQSNPTLSLTDRERRPSVKSIGQLLMFRPETGSLSLNLNVTKNLFQVLGGKLTIRQRPEEGEVLTIFLPLGNPQVQRESHAQIFLGELRVNE